MKRLTQRFYPIYSILRILNNHTAFLSFIGKVKLFFAMETCILEDSKEKRPSKPENKIRYCLSTNQIGKVMNGFPVVHASPN